MNKDGIKTIVVPPSQPYLELIIPDAAVFGGLRHNLTLRLGG